MSPEGYVTKRVRVTVTCDVAFHGEDDHTVIVTGTCYVMPHWHVMMRGSVILHVFYQTSYFCAYVFF